MGDMVRYSNQFGYLLCTLVFFESMMNKLLITVLPIENILGYVMIIVIAFTILTNDMFLSKKFLIYYCLILGMLFTSIIFVGGKSSIEYTVWMFSFSLCGVFSGFLNIDYKRVFKIGSLITIVFLLISIVEGFADAKVSSFAFGYALMPGILSTFFTLYNEGKKNRYFNGIVWLLVLVLEMLCIIKYCSRSNLLQLYVFAILCLLYIFRKKFLGYMGIVSMVLAIIFVKPLIIFLYELTTQAGIHISAIWKFHWLLTTANQSLLHGREELFLGVIDNTNFITLLLGHGIGAYEKIFETYAHNIYLQSLFEFGIVGCLLVICLYFLVFKQLADKKNSIAEKELYIFLMALPFMKLIFSSVHWRESLFWFAIVIVTKRLYKEKIIIRGIR